jgi:alkanesulfonate monooxygenase SsuD/methylene tetrahydromethanopterin reductase-like flavin-dependent oxidoreductase (luciferase family)
MLKLVWTQELSDFEGKNYTLRQARHEPKPVQKPYPPITIGGAGEQLTLRVVAKHADMYNGPGGDLQVLAHKNKVLEEHCAAIGRDPNEIRRSTQFYMRDAAEVSTIRDLLKGYIDVGMEHVCIGVPTEYVPGLVERVAEQASAL